MIQYTLCLFLSIFVTLIGAYPQLTHPLCPPSGTAGTNIHVPDPTSCSTYLYCQYNETNLSQLIAVHQLDCRNQNSAFFEFDNTAATPTGKCVDLHPRDCTGSSYFCPDSPLMIANPTDTNCRQFRPCTLPGFPWQSCREPLVFNRNTGACDLEVNAPCSDNTVPPEAQCPPGHTGKAPGTNCWSYLFCFEGDNLGEFDCPTGWKFVESLEDCDEDTAGTCVRPLSFYEIPRVRNGVSQKQKKAKEFTIKVEGF